jgi:hypothetical protein
MGLIFPRVLEKYLLKQGKEGTDVIAVAEDEMEDMLEKTELLLVRTLFSGCQISLQWSDDGAVHDKPSALSQA